MHRKLKEKAKNIDVRNKEALLRLADILKATDQNLSLYFKNRRSERHDNRKNQELIKESVDQF